MKKKRKFEKKIKKNRHVHTNFIPIILEEEKNLKVLLIILSGTLFFSNCEKLRELGRENTKRRLGGTPVNDAEIEKWKEKLNLQEAEVIQLDERIRDMVKITKQAGALSWKIAQAYMKVGSYDYSLMYYQKAIEEQNSDQFNTANSRPELHSFESAIVFFEKALKYKNIDENLLYETGLAYGNASRDRGWDKERRTVAVNIFKGLMKINSGDMRYPYQLALIFFDSSMTDGLVEGVDPEGYNDAERALKILFGIVRFHEEKNQLGETIPIRFTIANFFYRQGRSNESEEQYEKIKAMLEKFNQEGSIRNLDKNESYQSVVRNLKKIKEAKKNDDE
jgi:tetratricopeptide (TPR) repeat protein